MFIKGDMLQKISKVLKRENLEIVDEFAYPSINWMDCAQWHDVYRSLDTKLLGAQWREHLLQLGH